jgi:DNA-binding MarR family transcriptional regulator
MGNVASGSEQAQSCLSFLVRQAWLSMRQAVDAALEEYHLSVAQYAAMLVLADQPGASPSEVARVVASTRQSATETLAGLEREGLVERRRNPASARTHQVFLTDAGRDRLALARPAVQERERLMEQDLTDEQGLAARKWLAHMVAASEV